MLLLFIACQIFKQLLNAKFYQNIEQSIEPLLQSKYQIYAFDVNAEQSIFDVRFPQKSAFIIGHEEYGLSFEKEKFPLGSTELFSLLYEKNSDRFSSF